MTDGEILELHESERQPVECWTRVMGYFRPVSYFNKGKKSEFKERVWFTEQKACPCSREEVAAENVVSLRNVAKNVAISKL